MGDTEASYFLPARESGVNDMALHVGCVAPRGTFDRERVLVVLALLRIRHPLLASRVEMHSYHDIRFVYQPPRSVQDALDDAEASLQYRNQTKDELYNTFMNGPRILSQDRLSFLIISCPSPSSVKSGKVNYDLLLCSTHFLGDGIALHRLTNDFFKLLGGTLTDEQLLLALTSEWQSRCLFQPPDLPTPLEDRLPHLNCRLSEQVARVDYHLSQEKLIGGHTFPRRCKGPRKTITPLISLDNETTKNILKTCKSHGVSFSSALFALCNIAWAKTSGKNPRMPMMMYSAVNLRPYLLANPILHDSYYYLAIGYFNVVLPSFLPRPHDLASIFWHRARSAKKQSADAAKNPMAIPRTREMARERGVRARIWAKEDDDKATGIWTPPAAPTKPQERLPSNALIGISSLGNLDGIYQHAAYGAIRLHTLTTGSRQRSGGMLLFGYTFVGKLWLSLGFDENGFEKEVVDKFWESIQTSIQEFLISSGSNDLIVPHL